MNAVVGCKVEGNLCWNCKYIAKCCPQERPQHECTGYEPLGRYVTHQRIATWLNMERHHLCWVLKKYGVDEVIKMLETRGHIVRYEAEQNLKFFWLGDEKLEETDNG